MDMIDDVPGRAAHRLYYHFVWPTLGRIPLVSAEAVAVVESHVITLCRRLDSEPVCVRAFSDRVHLLLRLKPAHSPARVVSRLKSGSEAALQTAGYPLRWGRGYAAATVSGSDVREVRRRVHRLPDGPLPAGDARPKPRARRPSLRSPGTATSGVDGLHPTR